MVPEVGTRRDSYKVKYVIDLEIVPVITEIRFYPDENGKFSIPEENKSDVVYGPTIQTVAVDLYSEGIVSNDRIAEVIAHRQRHSRDDGIRIQFLPAFPETYPG